jgi:phosphatidylglycerophosphate synthase
MNISTDQVLPVEEIIEPVNRYFHNPLAASIVQALKNTSITPNQVTYFSVFVGLVSAYIFSIGTLQAFFFAGILLEIVLILDCVDGQLARAKGCSSDLGRLIDGIAGYVIYLSVLTGVMIGIDKEHITLVVFGVITILRGIAYDYCKLTIITTIQKGYNGSVKEILDIYFKVSKNNSTLFKTYFYYLQLQRLIFCGYFTSFDKFTRSEKENHNDSLLSSTDRKEYQKKIRPLMIAWSWNGVDLPLFILVLMSLFGVIESGLLPLVCFLALQFIFIMTYHRIQTQRLADFGKRS